MWNVYDIAYWIGLVCSSPVWLAGTRTRHKVLRALSQRMSHVGSRIGDEPAVMIHAVSLGEMNATRGLVDRLRALRPDLHFIITSTTDTGFTRAHELYAPVRPAEPLGHALGLLDHPPTPVFSLLRYPLDFTPAVVRLLDGLRPSVVVLMELEIWPNFMRQCELRKIPVIVVNGRITEPSFRKYRWLGSVARRMFCRLSAACVQEQVYAERFAQLGSRIERVSVTGTMKFDTAAVAQRVDGDEQLCRELQISPAAIVPSSLAAERFWVCGSTGPGEEALILQEYRRLLSTHARLRLVIVPRKPERFDEVARLIEEAGFQVVRRSQTVPATRKGQLLAFLSGSPEPQGKAPEPPRTLLPPVILGDTMGELRKFYALADVVFVGRTLVDLGPRQHGSDMIEPAAMGKAVLVGPFTGNFAEVMDRLREARAVREIKTAGELGDGVSELLWARDRGEEMGRRAQEVVAREKGATERHAQEILRYLPPAAE